MPRSGKAIPPPPAADDDVQTEDENETGTETETREVDPKTAQRLAALKKAQASRMAKAELKRKEKACRLRKYAAKGGNITQVRRAAGAPREADDCQTTTTTTRRQRGERRGGAGSSKTQEEGRSESKACAQTEEKEGGRAGGLEQHR